MYVKFNLLLILKIENLEIFKIVNSYNVYMDDFKKFKFETKS